MSTPIILHTKQELQKYTQKCRDEGQKIAFVPTMGFLHDGHMSLVRSGHESADVVIVSIFVNPTQFGPNEDLDAYPSDMESDIKICAENNVAVIYNPSPKEMYPTGNNTTVNVAGVSDGLCGAARPGHFEGVATVVTKLLMQVRPDAALFGLKDYQQFKVLDRMNKELDLGFNIIGVPIARETDTGLALSSRNTYLTEEDRKTAVQFNKILKSAASDLKTKDAATVKQDGINALKNAGFVTVDYFEICDTETLKYLEDTAGKSAVQILAAAKVGRARLIDNIRADLA